MKKIFTLALIFTLTWTSGYSQTAPDFTFTDTNGDSHTLSEALAEGKVILLDFFFVNCGSCISLAPEIDQIIEDYEGTTLEVWAISDRDSDVAIENSIFKSTHEHHFTGGSAGGGAAAVNLFAGNFNFTGFPTYAVVCNDNSITWDIWPLTAGANQIRSRLTPECGVVETLTAVSTIEGMSGTQLFPNPTSTAATLEFNLEEKTTISIELVNTLGQVVQSISSQNYDAGMQSINIDVSSLAKGIYAVNMRSKTGTHTIQLSTL